MTLNANGIRSAHRKNFFPWMLEQQADIVCIQEVRAHSSQLNQEILKPNGYFSYFRSADKKGYSGVAIYSRRQPYRITYDLGWESADSEGRFIQVDFDNLSIVSMYMPSGSSGETRQAVKYDFMDRFMRVIKRQCNKQRDYIICGDWNIAHKEIDLKNWRANKKNSGFLPEERAWMDELFGKVGMVDAFRVVNQSAEQYTWWSNRGQSWSKNVGWRLDYQVVTPALASLVKSAHIFKRQRFSDHAPLIIEYDQPF